MAAVVLLVCSIRTLPSPFTCLRLTIHLKLACQDREGHLINNDETSHGRKVENVNPAKDLDIVDLLIWTIKTVLISFKRHPAVDNPSAENSETVHSSYTVVGSY